MVRVSGFLSPARSGANGPEWTHDGPQNGPQILREFWGRLGAYTVVAIAACALVADYLTILLYLLYSEYWIFAEYSCKIHIFTVQ
jgi:hypothetical protein